MKTCQYWLRSLTLSQVFLLCAQAYSAQSLKESRIPYYKEARLGTIQVTEEGEEGFFSRPGLTTVGPKIKLLSQPGPEVLNKWSAFLCSNIKSSDSIYFVIAPWPKLSSELCNLKDLKGVIIDSGSFGGTGILTATLSSKTRLLDGSKILAVLSLDPALKVNKLLKAIAAIAQDHESGGETNVEFVTEKEAVLRFDGYVSSWQLILTRPKDTKDIEIKQIK